MTHVNQAPTASAASPWSVDRGVPTTIPITVNDPDDYDVETFKITSISTVGSYVDASSNAISSTPYSLAAVNVGALDTASQSITYTAPVNSAASSSFSFTATDAAGSVSSPVTVTINVKPNQVPVATAVTALTFSMHGNSASFTLGGTDSDPADTSSTLQVVLTQLPSKGTLVLASDSSTVSTLGTYANNVAFYIRGRAISGTDQLSFRVVDDILALFSS